MKNILLTVEYDGTNFFGWQRQPGLRTVQGELERVLSSLCRQNIILDGASRTDAGVHAFGQKASFRGRFGIPTDRIPMAANRLLIDNRRLTTGDVRILKAEEMNEEFHPRFDAIGKKYVYVMHNSREPNLMQRNYCYHVERPLDVKKMKIAAAGLIGKQDFECFMAAGGKPPNTTVRTIFSAGLIINGNRIKFGIIGDGFLYNMVRIIAGTLVDIGLGKIPQDAMPGIIESRNRQQAGHTAPPGGLYLTQVYYDKEEMVYEN